MAAEENIFISPLGQDHEQIPEVSLIDYIFPKLRTYLPKLGDKECFVDAASGKSVKFRDLEDLSLRVASSLARLGFKHGDVLYHVTWETAHLCIVQFAAWRLGGAWQGRHPIHLVEEYTRDMRESEVKFVLVDEDSAPTLREAISALEWPVKLLCFGDVDGAMPVDEMLQDDGSAMPEHVNINPRKDVAVILYTTGSTGPPKGAIHTHYTGVALMESLRMVNTSLDIDGSFLASSMNYTIGHFIVIVSNLIQGTKNYMIGNLRKHDLYDMIQKCKPKRTLMFSSFAAKLCRHPNLENMNLPSFLEDITIVGWTLDAATVEEFTRRLPKIEISQAYVMTECIVVSTSILSRYTNENNVSSIPILEQQGHRYTSSGRLVPSVKVKIVDPKTGRTLQCGERGEIRVKSATVMLGYLQPGSKILNRKDFDADGWLCTGDVGFFDASGELYVIERINSTYKYIGLPVFPSEIEAVLQDHQAVHSVGVVGMPEPEVECASRAFVMLRPGHHVSADELQKHVAARLPEHKHLHGGVRFVTELPINDAGKLDRKQLRKIALNLM